MKPRLSNDNEDMRIYSAKNKGLTLLELMLTLTIFSTVIGLLLNAFVQLNLQNEQTTAVLELRQEIRILEQLIREDVLAAIYLHEYMVMASKTLDGRRSGIVGISDKYGDHDADAIHMHVHQKTKFLRTLDFSSDPELYEVSYFLDTTDIENPKLKRREELYIDADIGEGDRSVTHVLSQRVIAFNIVYYDSGSTEEEEWSSYEKTQKLPAGLQFTLKLKNEKGSILESAFQVNLRPSMGSYATWKYDG